MLLEKECIREIFMKKKCPNGPRGDECCVDVRTSIDAYSQKVIDHYDRSLAARYVA